MRARLAAVAAAVTCLVAWLPLAAPSAGAKCCVWRVTDAGGQHVLYLAGSVHALRQSDLPLPAAYNRALAESKELVFETDPDATPERWTTLMTRAASFPKNTTLREHVDPRTYDYLRRILARTKGATKPEEKIAHLRAWAVSWMLEAPGEPLGAQGSLGVDRTLRIRARQAGKQVSGLVSLEEHVNVFGGLSDAEGEALLLVQFIQLDTHRAEYARDVAAWRQGDTGTLDRDARGDYRDVPYLYQRIITERNRRWLPKLENYLRSDPTRMIVAGAAHMSGPEGLPALLQAAGYRVEQL